MLFEDSLPFYLYQDALLSSTTQQQFEMKPEHRFAAATPSPANSKRAASKVAPRLYLTCLATARDATQLAQLGITHVVSAIEDAPTFPSSHPLRTLHIPVSDYASEDILSHLPATTSFIRGALAESPTNRVLVRIASLLAQTARQPDTLF
jgi:atypical dual specificity phosphatase